MALNIKNSEVESLAADLAHLTGESETEAIRQALLERRAHLRFRVSESARGARIRPFLEREVWSRVPEDQSGEDEDVEVVNGVYTSVTVRYDTGIR